MVTIAEGFQTCVESGDCLDVTTSPTPSAALYVEIDIDPDGGIRCTPNGLAAVGGAALAAPASPVCSYAQPGAPLDNALGVLPDGSPFIPDHFVGDKIDAFRFGLPTSSAIPLNTYAALIPTVVINNNWCRDAQLLAFLFNNANVVSGAGSRFELRSEIALDAAPFIATQFTPTIMANSPTAVIQQDKPTSASIFVDPYGFNGIVVPAGGVRTVRLRTGVFSTGPSPDSDDLWANVGSIVHAILCTKS